MMQNRLKIYTEPNEESCTEAVYQAASAPHKVTVPLGEVFPLLADAVLNDKAWLKDFADDEITISNDLYEVILAYDHYRRPSA